LMQRSSIAYNARRNMKQKYIFSECCLPLDVILFSCVLWSTYVIIICDKLCLCYRPY
jgi:hypothetical protein